jgi:integrase
VRDFLLHIRNIRKLTVRTYNNYFYSIKKFYEHFIPNQNFLGDLRRMREPVHQPIVLSKEDVLTLIDAAPNLKIKAAIALFYASGIRVEECSLLKMSCIDRKRMVIRIELGKGARDRITVLSHTALEIMGEYWREYRPEVYLFEGHNKKPLSRRRLEAYVSETAQFIRRFLLHVLLRGFMRIRHYGFLSNSNRVRNREQFETIFASLKQKKKECPKKSGIPWNLRIKERTGKDPLCCKKCGKGSLMLIEILNPVKNKNAEYVNGS